MDQSRKNIALLISFGILSLISLILLLSGREKANDIDPTLFKLPESKAVDQVTLEKSNEKIDLEFLNGSWRVTASSMDGLAVSPSGTPRASSGVRGPWEADLDMIDVLFATVEQAKPKRSVATRLRDSIANQIDKSGIKVSFISNANIQKVFSVLGDEEGGITYFLNPEDDNPYIMAIPGYRVYVAGIFEQDANAWRDKRIFNFNWRNFKELKAEFPRDQKQDFTVAMTGRYFSIVGENKIDTASLNNYLDAVSLIDADAFYKIGESIIIDSLSRSKPILTITVKDVSEQIYSLKLFAIGKDKRNSLSLWNDDLVWFDRRNILQLYKMKKDFVTSK